MKKKNKGGTDKSIKDDRQTSSIWMTAARPDFSPLSTDKRTEVCVIGAGIAGLTTAYLLTREGKNVVVLDDGPIGSGMTQRTTAHLSNALDDRYSVVEFLHGQKGAKLSADSHTAAIDQIEEICTSENINCDFQRLDGYLFTSPDEMPDTLLDELEAVHRAGLTQTFLLERVPLGFFDTGPCLRFPRQAQFHPLKYLSGIASALDRMGGIICTGSHVHQIHEGLVPRIETTLGFSINADAVVVTTNTPINQIITIHLKQAPYTTYAIAARIPAGSVPAGLYWDTADPYHYIRMQPGPAGYDFLIIGGEDHKTGQANDQEQRHDRLEKWARERFPMMEQIDFRWSGMVMEPDDKIAFIGRCPGKNNIYMATGDSGMGITHGTISGMLIRDLILGRDNPWKDLYDPSRITFKALATYVKENVNAGLKAIGGYLSTGDVTNAAEIPPDEGAIMRRGVLKIAVYRDETGKLHERSAICRHLECIVSWNGLEKTWDCPCHGSRYDRFGTVINGPAIEDLKLH
jgi:glycine/D-amino acid oxidase-like deaminating enzyme/nitrite reductase/ring-hydroxylating ferredoxin subunit